uniref:NADH-ubiquinone oxidoreductase chain 5 n=1 Tax=Calotes versicolor TaxID=48253 RepID=A6P3A4_CALVC|nr:NADH dehydrogenase subunit 5 [Calotes versicolor]BAF69014.1 NADH dehydrogenase subunit 5 [Calotes versicolor]
MTHVAMITTSTLPLIILTMPLFSKKINKNLSLTNTIKITFFTSIFPMLITMKHSINSLSTSITLTDTRLMNAALTTTINKYSAMFMPTALLITWSIMEFSPWYVQKTKLTKNFTKLLTTFLISMLILATAGSLLQLLIGWEGVGIMSFLLINWWFSRSNANSSALQAIIYNRIGDIGLILIMVALATDLSSWDNEQTMTTNTKTTLLSTGFILAATGKSAQFFMHLWLPAAMEGPTPVSALLHSSTMVVAGVYLLAQYHPMLNPTMTTTICLCLGMTTSIYAASSALVQNDMKKIIAFSTSSQLGLMMTAIGMNCPNLAILHMLSHATFKATLFLAAGSTIHNAQNEQDIRKMGAMKITLPISSTALTTNGLALSGLPFLSGFYSKDTILETLFSSHLNAWALLATLISTTMTSSYTMRMIIITTTKTPNHKPMTMFSESETQQTAPLIRLTLTTIIVGPALLTTLLDSPHPPTLTTLEKIAPTMALMLGAYLVTELTDYFPSTTKTQTLTKLLNNLAFFKTLHRNLPNRALNTGYLVSHQLTDLLWLEKSGPNTIINSNVLQSKITSSQKGLLKNYLMTLLITLAIATTILMD